MIKEGESRRGRTGLTAGMSIKCRCACLVFSLLERGPLVSRYPTIILTFGGIIQVPLVGY